MELLLVSSEARVGGEGWGVGGVGGGFLPHRPPAQSLAPLA